MNKADRGIWESGRVLVDGWVSAAILGGIRTVQKDYRLSITPG